MQRSAKAGVHPQSFLDSRPRFTCGASFTGMTMKVFLGEMVAFRLIQTISMSGGANITAHPRIKYGAGSEHVEGNER